MKIEFEHSGKRFTSDLSKGRSLAISLNFDGDQPSHFGAPKASRAGLKLGDFVGRTSHGSGCNVDELAIIPHCNGTHTETVAHIVNDDVFVGGIVPLMPVVAAVVTVTPQLANETKDSYRPPFGNVDRIISADVLKSAIDESSTDIEALIVRTLPNSETKRNSVYEEKNQPAFFSIEAMGFIVGMGIKHLLVDLPSVDRMYDDGWLTNHHLFWNVDEGTHELLADSRKANTISELVFVPDSISDGLCLLSLQVPDFCTDAAPSRPLVFPIDEVAQ